MTEKKIPQENSSSSALPVNKDSNTLFNNIFNFAKRDLTRLDFLKEVSKAIINFTGCNAVEIWLEKEEKEKTFKIIRYTETSSIRIIQDSTKNIALKQLCMGILLGNNDKKHPKLLENGSFYSGNMETLLSQYSEQDRERLFGSFKSVKKFYSIVIIPILLGEKTAGLLQLKSKRKNFFTRGDIEFFENFSQTFGLILISQRAQAALRERIKELACLHTISNIAEQYGDSIKDMLQNIVELLPPAWQYPEITCGKIVLDGHEYVTNNFKETPYIQSTGIIVNGEKRGMVNVVYSEKKPLLDEGPFLKEERNLINSIARELALIIERRQTLEDKERLNNQLRHADRLATIGQLSAGVAHELNEPLGAILGFSQLIQKNDKLPASTLNDVGKIVNSSLHAREIVRKLLIFARQMPTKMTEVDLNRLIKEGIFFLESRCAKEDIKLAFSLADDLPAIKIDPSQITQVLVNLVVNAIQSMPQGGELEIKTSLYNDYIYLTVSDTGIGMNEDVINKIFLPFFTTKEIGQGTGLGMSVVNGIITSHKGTIKIESEVGHGSKIEIKLPAGIDIMENTENESTY